MLVDKCWIARMVPCFSAVVLNCGSILSPRAHSAISGDIFSCHNWRTLLASNGVKPKMIQPKMSVMPSLITQGFNENEVTFA